MSRWRSRKWFARGRNATTNASEHVALSRPKGNNCALKSRRAFRYRRGCRARCRSGTEQDRSKPLCRIHSCRCTATCCRHDAFCGHLYPCRRRSGGLFLDTALQKVAGTSRGGLARSSWHDFRHFDDVFRSLHRCLALVDGRALYPCRHRLHLDGADACAYHHALRAHLPSESHTPRGGWHADNHHGRGFVLLAVSFQDIELNFHCNVSI